MPRSPLLLVNPTPEVIDAFVGSGLWEITICEHTRERPDPSPPDPAQWTLILANGSGFPDRTRTKALELGLRLFRTTREYFRRDASNANIYEFAPQQALTLSGMDRAGKETWVSFDLVPDDHPMAPLMLDWVRDFKEGFIPGRLTEPNLPDFNQLRRGGVEGVFSTSENYAAIVWNPAARILTSLGLHQEYQPHALTQFASRVAPRLWPGTRRGEFASRRVQTIQSQLVDLAATYEEGRKRLEEELAREVSYWSRLEGLTLVGGDSLVRLAGDALSDVLGLVVKDLDAKADAEFESRTADLHASDASVAFIIEITGRPTRSLGRDDIQDAVRRRDIAAERYGIAGANVFVVNGQYTREPRPSNLFNSEIVQEAASAGICLVDTAKLLRGIEALREGDWTRGEFLAALGTCGEFIPPPRP